MLCPMVDSCHRSLWVCSPSVTVGHTRHKCSGNIRRRLSRGAGRSASTDSHVRALPYDSEYPVVAYRIRLPHNPIARLQSRLLRGEAKTRVQTTARILGLGAGANLCTDPGSHILFDSQSRLQKKWATVITTQGRSTSTRDIAGMLYLGVKRGRVALQFVTMDSELGPVFYNSRRNL